LALICFAPSGYFKFGFREKAVLWNTYWHDSCPIAGKETPKKYL